MSWWRPKILIAFGPPLLLALRGRSVAEMLSGARGTDVAWASLLALVWPLLIFALSRWRWLVALWRGLKAGPARWGLAIVLVLHLIALFAPLLETHPPAQLGQPVVTRYQAPSGEHWMGTDLLGRDLYSRVVRGSRISLAIGVFTVVLHVALGVLVGGLAGFFGGKIDTILMRFTDLLLAFPRIFLLLAIVALFQPSTWMIIVVLGVTGWMGVARVVRGEVLRIQTMEWVDAARALGLPSWRILARHILPAALSLIIAQASLRVGNTILTESFLSFLGLGVTDPDVSWGMLIRGGRSTLLSAWWVSTFPGLAILLTVVGYNLLGDGLRDLYDPRLRGEVPRP